MYTFVLQYSTVVSVALTIAQTVVELSQQELCRMTKYDGFPAVGGAVCRLRGSAVGDGSVGPEAGCVV